MERFGSSFSMGKMIPCQLIIFHVRSLNSILSSHAIVCSWHAQRYLIQTFFVFLKAVFGFLDFLQCQDSTLEPSSDWELLGLAADN